jgi:hypothetical protein
MTKKGKDREYPSKGKIKKRKKIPTNNQKQWKENFLKGDRWERRNKKKKGKWSDWRQKENKKWGKEKGEGSRED